MQTPSIQTAASVTALHAAIASNAHPVVTIKMASELRPAFTPAALRDLKFKAHDRKNSRGEVIKGNGTGPAGVWLQVGAKVLIDLDAFDRWLESHRTGSVN